MPWDALLTRLRDALAELYPDATDARRVATDVLLSTNRIELTGKAVNVWQSILEEAEKQGKVRDVVALASREYPQCASLQAALADYVIPAMSGAPQLYRDDAVARLSDFKRLLSESWYVFDEQSKRIRQLHARLKRRLKSQVPDDVGFDETFFRLYDEMDHKERNFFYNIRVMTGRLHDLNKQMRRWAAENPSLHVPLQERLDRQLDQLRLHLDLWFDRYNNVFLASERRSHVFLLDLDVPGVSFPEDLEKTVDDILLELKRQ